MATPVRFREYNVHFLGQNEHDATAAWQGQQSDGQRVIITCWQLTPDELAEIQRTGRVWLRTLSRRSLNSSVEAKRPFLAMAVDN